MLTSQKSLLLKAALKKSTCPSKNVGASTCSLLSESIRGNVRRWWSSWRLSGNFAAIMTAISLKTVFLTMKGWTRQRTQRKWCLLFLVGFLLKGWLKDVEGFGLLSWINTAMVVFQCVWTCFCNELMEMIKWGYRCYSPCKWIMWLPYSLGSNFPSRSFPFL